MGRAQKKWMRAGYNPKPDELPAGPAQLPLAWARISKFAWQQKAGMGKFVKQAN
jgi:hypothetical protein